MGKIIEVSFYIEEGEAKDFCEVLYASGYEGQADTVVGKYENQTGKILDLTTCNQEIEP